MLNLEKVKEELNKWNLVIKIILCQDIVPIK